VVQAAWAGWKALHPETTVVSFDTGFRRNYDVYPYGSYDQIGNEQLLFPQSVVDPRLPMKETVLSSPARTARGRDDQPLRHGDARRHEASGREEHDLRLSHGRLGRTLYVLKIDGRFSVPERSGDTWSFAHPGARLLR
jgi:hypothetical protein